MRRKHVFIFVENPIIKLGVTFMAFPLFIRIVRGNKYLFISKLKTPHARMEIELLHSIIEFKGKLIKGDV